MSATAIGCALAWGGLVVPPMRPLYDYAWFVGFLASGAAHLALAPRRSGVGTPASQVAERSRA
jgi:NCS1 family nucleobase:cation symporter-1